MERFNGKLRDECLNTSWFWNLFDARKKRSQHGSWNISRGPHSSLGYATPDEFARQWKAASLSEAKSMPGGQATVTGSSSTTKTWLVACV
jgi:putative transposase